MNYLTEDTHRSRRDRQYIIWWRQLPPSPELILLTVLDPFLSGAGSTILALSSGREMTTGYKMAKAASKAGVDGDVIVTKPTTDGVRVVG